MKFRYLLILTMLFSIAVADDSHDTAQVAIGEVIDNFHAAAARGDKARYLGLLADEAVFMGTDEWERWPRHPDFENYVSSRFKDGKGWEYQSVERTIRMSESSNTAWFDEVIESASNGRFRGTGVLVLNNGSWRIAHYAMSFLVFNEDWDAVVELSRKTRQQKDRVESSH
ncbi:MAG: nuclear transport factor 2 family protein [Gammaproteobacteria bacterium]|nr:nuclear transport factor 2 family protein [Gammaproteobacteria bacterium]